MGMKGGMIYFKDAITYLHLAQEIREIFVLDDVRSP